MDETSADQLKLEQQVRHIISLIDVRPHRRLLGYAKQLFRSDPNRLSLAERTFYFLLRRYQALWVPAALSRIAPHTGKQNREAFKETVRYIKCITTGEDYNSCRRAEWEAFHKSFASAKLPDCNPKRKTDSIKASNTTPQDFTHRFRNSGLFSEMNTLLESIAFAAENKARLTYAFPEESNPYASRIRELLSCLDGDLFQIAIGDNHVRDVTEESHAWFSYSKFERNPFKAGHHPPFAITGSASRKIYNALNKSEIISTSVPEIPQEDFEEPNRVLLSYFIRQGDKIGTESLPYSASTISRLINKDLQSMAIQGEFCVRILGDSKSLNMEVLDRLRKGNERRASERPPLADQAASHPTFEHIRPPHDILNSRGYKHSSFIKEDSKAISQGIENMLFISNQLMQSNHFSGDPLCNLVQFCARCAPEKYLPSHQYPFFP